MIVDKGANDDDDDDDDGDDDDSGRDVASTVLVGGELRRPFRGFTRYKATLSIQADR